MTKTIASQAVAAVLAVAATFATASGVTHIASQQFAMAEKAAMSQTGEQVASVQHVVVVARRLA
ncbi:MAG TPA: hypothetical protein VF453_04125, partial [Burkholderiaceae bacterium]